MELFPEYFIWIVHFVFSYFSFLSHSIKDRTKSELHPT